MKTYVAAIFAAFAFLVASTTSANAQEWKLGVSMVADPSGGVRVVSVFPNSPAKKIGLAADNLILTVDGNLVNDPLALRDYIFDGRTGIRLVYQNEFGFMEEDVEFEVVTAIVAAPPIVSYDARGKRVVKSAPKVMGKTLKIKSIRKRAVSDPRLKLGTKPTLKKVSKQKVNRFGKIKTKTKTVFKPKANPFVRP